jgi:hypothetical protein
VDNKPLSALLIACWVSVDNDRANVSCPLLKAPLCLIYSLINKEADLSWAFRVSCCVAKVKPILSWVTGGGGVRVPPRLLDGDDVEVVDPWVAQQRRHDHVSRLAYVVL